MRADRLILFLTMLLLPLSSAAAASAPMTVVHTQDVPPWHLRAPIAVPFAAILVALAAASALATARYRAKCREAGQLREKMLEQERLAGAALEREVAERRKAEESARELREFYHSLVDNIPHYVTRKDVHGRYTYANAKTGEWWGLGSKDFLGRDDSVWAPPELCRQIQEHDAWCSKPASCWRGVTEVKVPGGQDLYPVGPRADPGSTGPGGRPPVYGLGRDARQAGGRGASRPRLGRASEPGQKFVPGQHEP